MKGYPDLVNLTKNESDMVRRVQQLDFKKGLD